MELLTLQLRNFQGIKSAKLCFDGKSAAIYGDNATGKTTVFNAVTWLLFDKASTGAKNFSPKSRGADGELHHLEHSAEAVFRARDGGEVSLKKTYRELYKKKRGSVHEEFSGHAVEYAIDGVPAKEKEYAVALEGLCGGSSEQLKMLTMPDYVPGQLTWDARRKLLLEICGDVSDEDVIASCGELGEITGFLHIPGTEDKYYSVEDYKKIAAAKKKDIASKLESIPGRIDEAERAIPETASANAEEISGRLAELTARRDRLQEDRAAAASGGAGMERLRTERAKLQTRIEAGRAEHQKRQNKLAAGIDAEILEARRKCGEARRSAEDAAADLERLKAKLGTLSALREELLESYHAAGSELWDDGLGICPTCNQPLPAGEVDRLRAEFNLRKSKKLEAINRRGQTEASKAMLEDLQCSIAETSARAEAAETEARDAREKSEALRAGKAPGTPFEDTAEYKELSAALAALDKAGEDERRVKEEATASVRAELDAVVEEIRTAESMRMKLDIAASQRQRIEELEREEERLNREYEELEKGLYLCEMFIKAKVSALTERINSKFNSVRFRLFQEQINGGLKEDCEVMIPTADGSMVPYSVANNAARINAGLEIIEVLSASWGISMPVFVDNAESVTRLAETRTQTIRLVVSEADKKMRLELYSN